MRTRVCARARTLHSCSCTLHMLHAARGATPELRRVSQRYRQRSGVSRRDATPDGLSAAGRCIDALQQRPPWRIANSIAIAYHSAMP